jgi:hypothetical protein
MVQERYLSPGGKYAVEIVGTPKAFSPSQVYVGLACSKDRQLLGQFDLPVQGSPLFLENNRFLVVHTGSLSSGTWPIVFVRTGESVFEQVHAFDQEGTLMRLKCTRNFRPIMK